MWLLLKLSIFSVHLFLTVITHFRICSGQHVRDHIIHDHIRPGAVLIKDSMSDILQDCWKKVEDLEKIRQTNLNYANYEIGYLTHIIQNKYRKMLDRYYSVVIIGHEPLFLFDLIIILEEIEHGYFQLDHIIRMLSQVERKYGITTPITERYEELTLDEEIKEEANKKEKEKKGQGGTSDNNEGTFDINKGTFDMNEGMFDMNQERPEVVQIVPQTRYVPTTRKQTVRKKFSWKKYYKELKNMDEIKEYYYNYTKKPSSRWWWPIEYGWEIDYAWYF